MDKQYIKNISTFDLIKLSVLICASTYFLQLSISNIYIEFFPYIFSYNKTLLNHLYQYIIIATLLFGFIIFFDNKYVKFMNHLYIVCYIFLFIEYISFISFILLYPNILLFKLFLIWFIIKYFSKINK
jgi:hypothetical protein